MLIRRQKYLATLLLLLTFLAGCNSVEPTPTATASLRPLIVQPADMGWPDDSYFEGESYIPGELAVETMISAGIGPDPLPRRSSNISTFRSGQDVWIYGNEDAATQTFNLMIEHYEFGFLSKGSYLELPDLTNTWWFCYEGLYDSAKGNYANCFVLAQKENILIRGIMPVNEKFITMEDWHNYMSQIHKRLVDYSLDSETQN